MYILHNFAIVVATIGPACANAEEFEKMMLNGLNVARMNFSHGTHDAHASNLKMMRQVAAKLNKPLCVLQDLQGIISTSVNIQGPKIRIGKLINDAPVKLIPGKQITITTDAKYLGNESKVGTTYLHLAHDARIGSTILIDDGLLQLKVLSKQLLVPEMASVGDELLCEVVIGGQLSNSKGINLPGNNYVYTNNYNRYSLVGTSLDRKGCARFAIWLAAGY